MSAGKKEPITFKAAFEQIASGEGPGPETVRAAFEAILAGTWTPVQISGFLVALRLRGETAPVIAAAATAMRAVMVPVAHGLGETLDTCGTGGDGLGTLNFSTAAALVAAACGVTVAKHGNRAASSLAGSADVLEVLGIPLDLTAEQQARVLGEAKIAFLFARTHHPAMRHVGLVRSELGIRTLFNVLGPLSNPAGATHQLLGAYDDKLRPLMAESLRALGLVRAWVVRGEDGLDEVSPSAVTRVSELSSGKVIERTVTPEDFGLPRVPLESLRGGDARQNAAVLVSLLRGEPHPARPAVVLNAAAALVVARGIPLKEAALAADDALAAGKAFAVLERWKTAAAKAKGA